MKKIVVISMVKNEQDIIESFVRHCLTFADELLICDHMSSDQTSAILQCLQEEGLPLSIYEENDPAHVQAEVMTKLMHIALGQIGADIVVPLDADEFLLPAEGRDVRAALQDLDDTRVYHVPWRMFALAAPHQDEDRFLLARPLLMAAVDDEGQKILFGRGAVCGSNVSIVEGNHNLLQVDTDGETTFVSRQPQTTVRIAHFCWRSPEQYAAKIAVSWPNVIAKYSSCAGSDGHYKSLFQRLQAYGLPSMEDILPVGMLPVQLPAYLCRSVLRYSRQVRPDAMRNLMASSVLLAQQCAEERVLRRQEWVTILIPYLGDWTAVDRSLQSALSQSYPWKEIFVLEIVQLPAAQRAEIEQEAGDEVIILSKVPVAVMSEKLSNQVRGTYVQWLLPGDQIEAERLQKMVTCFELQDKHFAVLLSQEAVDNHVEPCYFMDLSRIRQDEALLTGYRRAWWQHILQQGQIPAGGIGAALIRREIMQNRQWLQACFLEKRPLEFTMWKSVLQERPEDGAWQMFGVMGKSYLQQVHDISAGEEQIFRQMEWACLLADAKDKLPADSYGSAVRRLKENEGVILSVLPEVVAEQNGLVAEYQHLVTAIG